MGVRTVVFGNHQGARGVFVQPVDNARPQATADAPQIRAVIKQAIDQCSTVMPRGRMHHQPGLLVDHHDKIVFIQNIKGNRLGFELYRNRRRDDA